MKLLITGVSGFTGHHMVRYLQSLSAGRPEIYGLYHRDVGRRHDGCRYIKGDLCDREEMQAAVRDTSPDAVIHLAGLNHGSLRDLLRINVVGTENLLEAVRVERPGARVLVVGSSAEYGYAGTAPIAESAPLCPAGAYGISKVAEDLLAGSYHTAHRLQVSVARPFNLIGPGQRRDFVCGRLAAEAVEVEQGHRDSIHMANLTSSRDFVDVRDVVDAYWRIITHGEFTGQCAGMSFNIGSGKSHAISEVLGIMEEITGRRYEITLPGSPAPELVPSQCSDNTRIESVTGWKPAFTLRQSLEDMINEARAP